MTAVEIATWHGRERTKRLADRLGLAVQAELSLLVRELGSATRVARALGISDRIISHIRAHGHATERTLQAVLQYRKMTGEDLMLKHGPEREPVSGVEGEAPRSLRRARPVLARFASKFPWKRKHTPMERKSMLRAASHLLAYTDPSELTSHECDRVFDLLQEVAASVRKSRGDVLPHVDPRMASPVNIFALAVRKFAWDERLSEDARERVARAAAVLLLDSDTTSVTAQSCARVLLALQRAILAPRHAG